MTYIRRTFGLMTTKSIRFLMYFRLLAIGGYLPDYSGSTTIMELTQDGEWKPLKETLKANLPQNIMPYVIQYWILKKPIKTREHFRFESFLIWIFKIKNHSQSQHLFLYLFIGQMFFRSKTTENFLVQNNFTDLLF